MVQGLALTPDDAWSVHSVAHVYEMRAEVDKGLKFMEEREKDWAVNAALPAVFFSKHCTFVFLTWHSRRDIS